MDTTRRYLAASDLDYVAYTAGSDPDRAIWAAAFQYPLSPGANRLILVRSAEKLRTWDPLAPWLAASRQLPGIHLLFVSSEPDFPGKKGAHAPHIEAIKQRGRIIRCATPNPDDAIAWVKTRAQLDDNLARYLLARVGGDLTAAAGVCAKLSLFDVPAGPHAINSLCAASPAEGFVDNLLANRKPEALLTAETLSPADLPTTVALLDNRIDSLAICGKALRAGRSIRDITEIPVFLARKLMPLAKDYTPTRCAHARRVLAVIDDAHRNGARIGVIEALVALW